MERVKSRYRPLLLAGTFLLIIAAAASWYFFIAIHDNARFHRRMLFISIFFTVLVFLAFVAFLRNIPVITISRTGIFFNYVARADTLVKWEEIKEIKPIDARRVNIGGNGATIILQNGPPIFISARNYGNMRSIRQALQHYNIKLKKETPPVRVSPGMRATSPDKMITTYAGNPWMTLNTITFIVVSSVPVVAFFANDKGWIFLLFIPLLYARFGTQMFYFTLSDEAIVVRNHYWFWYKKTHLVSDIDTCIFESPTRASSAGLCIISHDFTSKNFNAGSLRRAHWKAMRSKLKALKIKIINEAA